ncbi:MAG: ABC transporter ATP-binding protein [Candidatus Nomurabacteria bacterium]|nr:MAG: ABC transporter ATP-binding protein [Candidatus Nomurabacteria bacterium]
MTNDDNIAVRVSGVSKSFKLPLEAQNSLKGRLINFNKRGYEVQHALKDVSFDVKKGDFFGIVGRNGSGKSTLLKLISGIYSTDKGSIETNGKLVPFIELGVGFNPELSGRDNVYLNGALLGFNRKEMDAMYDDIVEFAELGRFMDQKLKNYSSGMQVRLAFSIAIRANTDILVLDEVLAVGDEAFQKKCIAIFEEYKARKQTIILVTHDMGVVEKFCNRAILIEDGVIKKEGSPTQVALAYRDSNNVSYARDMESSQQRKTARIERKIDIEILSAKTHEKQNRFNYGSKMIVRLRWDDAHVHSAGVAIMKLSGENIFAPNTYQDKLKLSDSTREIEYEVTLNLATGDYYIKAGLFGKTDEMIIAFDDEGPSFIVEPEVGGKHWNGLTKLDYKWKI